MRVIVHGRVQGVFFRDYTRNRAEELGLSGWVCNRPDQTVEAVFEGDDKKVADMLAWLHTGSPMSIVTDVDAVDEDPHGETGGFTIRY
jgi:acylphosphatase